MIFDTHCHLYDRAFNKDREQVIQRAFDNKVSLMLVPSDNIINSCRSIRLANEYENIYSAVGVFPGEVYRLDLEKSLLELEKMVKGNKKIKAIGEIGLDYFYYHEKDQQEIQKVWFRRQIELANKLALPVIVHSRDAAQDTLDLLDEVKPLYGCVFHCFSYSKEILKIIISRGYYIGLDGPVTFNNAVNPKEIATLVPLDRLFLETDSPYLTPVPHRGRRNEPSEIVYTAQEIARLRGITYDELTKATYENGRKFFSL